MEMEMEMEEERRKRKNLAHYKKHRNLLSPALPKQLDCTCSNGLSNIKRWAPLLLHIQSVFTEHIFSLSFRKFEREFIYFGQVL